MKNCKLLTVLILSVLFLVSTVNAGQVIIKDGVTYVTNSDVPSQGIKTLQLKKLWSVGGDDEEFIFSSINQVLLGKDNNLYVLDSRSDLIYVFDLAGKLSRSIDFSGEIFRYGTNRIEDMFLKDAEIGLLSKSPIQVICIDYFGNPGNKVELPPNFFLSQHADWENGNLILGGLSLDRREVFLTKFSVFGKAQIDYVLSKTELSFEPGKAMFSERDEYFWLSKPWDIHSDGRVYIAPHWSTPELGKFLINIYGNDDKLKVVASRQFKAYKRSQKERDMQGALTMGGYENLRQARASGDKYFEEEYEQDVLQILVHPDGNIWVKTSRSTKNQAKGVMVTYDVFSLQGYFITQVSLRVPGNGDKDIVYFVGNLIVIVKGQNDLLAADIYPEADKLEIICYSVE